MAVLQTCTMEPLLTKLESEFSVNSGSSYSMILMFSLDEIGDSTVLYKISMTKPDTKEICGSKIDKVSPVTDISFSVKDIKDDEKVRGLWRHCFQSSDDNNVSYGGELLRWSVSEINGFYVIFYSYCPTIKRTRRYWSDLQSLQRF